MSTCYYISLYFFLTYDIYTYTHNLYSVYLYTKYFFFKLNDNICTNGKKGQNRKTSILAYRFFSSFFIFQSSTYPIYVGTNLINYTELLLQTQWWCTATYLQTDEKENGCIIYKKKIE